MERLSKAVVMVVVLLLTACTTPRVASYSRYSTEAASVPGEDFCSELEVSANDFSKGFSVATVLSALLAAGLTIAGGEVLSHADGSVPTRNIGISLGLSGLISVLPTVYLGSRAAAASNVAVEASQLRTAEWDGRRDTEQLFWENDRKRFAKCAALLGAWEDRRSAVAEVNTRASDLVKSYDSSEKNALRASIEQLQKVADSIKDISKTLSDAKSTVATPVDARKLIEQLDGKVTAATTTVLESQQAVLNGLAPSVTPAEAGKPALSPPQVPQTPPGGVGGGAGSGGP